MAAWSVQVLPLGFLYGSAGIFHRVSSTSDVGLTVAVSLTDFDSDWLELRDDVEERLVDENNEFRTVGCYAEWRRWSGIWDSGEDASIRSYWGVRLILEQQEESWSSGSVGEQGSNITKYRSDAWRGGLAITLGMSGRVWKAVSLSAGLQPLAITRTQERGISEDINESYPSKSETESEGTDVNLGLEPRLYVVLAW